MKMKLNENTLWLVLRIALAVLISAHGWFRLLGEGHIAGFGLWLDTQGVPLGLYIAWAITLIEVIGPVFLILGKGVFPLALTYSAIYLAGIIMVHAPAGWFVVGGGRNGAEYSVLLIVALLCVGLRHLQLNRPEIS